MKAQVGDAVSFYNQDRKIPYVWQYSAGFQYELFHGSLFEASYVGSQTLAVQSSKNLNSLTADQLALGTTALNVTQPNPFYGVLPTASSRGQQATISRRNMILPYPQYTSVTESGISIGKSWYNSFQFKYQQRYKHGFTTLVSYTNSKNMEAVAFLNGGDPLPSRELVSWDVPQRLVLSGVYELPFGPRKMLLHSGVMSHVLRGWKASWTGTLQSGTPIPWNGSYYLRGNPHLADPTISRWFDTSATMWVVRPADTLRDIKLYSNNVRRYTAPQFNNTLIREFRIAEKHRFQVKVSAFNITNTPIFNNPDTNPTSLTFGQVPKAQRGLPRSVEIGLRYSF
jgi:hypothetical protein